MQAQASGRAALSSEPALRENWPVATGDYQNSRFRTLAQINAANVSSLKPAWSFSTGRKRGHEAAPLVVDGTMYVVTPYPTSVYALDLSRPEPSVKWQYDAKPTPAAQGVACCDVVNRGPASSDGRLFVNTLDNHSIALDANGT